VFATISEWLHARTKYRSLLAALLLEHIPGGAKWRYVWGSTLAFVFFVQLVTGVLLMTAYSPGATSAWSSVYFIQYEMDFGWFIRGLHHFGSQTMVVLLAIHMLQVVIAGAHLPPREINWWLGLLLMGAILGLSLTGYLLPWDQKGFWATQVATNIAGTLPVMGEFIQKIAVGGPEYGNATLTRFFALHVAILPPLVIVLIIAHIAIFRKHGVTTVEPEDHPKQGVFWPDQVFKDLVACLIVFGVMVTLVIFAGHGNKIEAEAGAEAPGFYEDWAKAGRKGWGANLDAPADRNTAGYPARPEWYFLFLFQLLKYFEGKLMIVGTVVIPQGAGILLFLLPLLGFGKMRRFGHVAGVLVVTSLVTGVGVLTLLALADDALDPVLRELLTLLGKVVVPAIGGVFLLHMGLLAVLPRNAFRKVVCALGVAVLAVLVVGSGLLVYAALADGEHYAQQEEGRKKAEERHEEAAVEAERQGKVDKEEAKKRKEDRKIAAFVSRVKGREHDGEGVLPRPLWEYVHKELEKKVDGADREQMLAHVKRQDEIAEFHHSLEKAKDAAERSVVQASRGIPVEGPTVLVRNDPMTHGRALFKEKCASCHSYTNPKTGKPEFPESATGFSASDLGGFGGKDWILGLLREPGKDEYFGRINRVVREKNKGRKDEDKLEELTSMINWAARPKSDLEKVDRQIQKLKEELKDPDGKLEPDEKTSLQQRLKKADQKRAELLEDQKELEKELPQIADWLAKHPKAAPPKDEDKGAFADGYRLFEARCSSCHSYGGKLGGTAPDLKDYGSPDWARLMMMSPAHKLRHPRNYMPAFLNEEGPGAEVVKLWFHETNKDPTISVIALTDIERELILRFLFQDDRVVFGGRPISGPPPRKKE
jgi:quinol-cytochrome oxidoreductase complex cytochrome b subunit/mono/diheme cytochrome c family protein